MGHTTSNDPEPTGELGENEVRHVARLGRLWLTDTQVEGYTRQLGSILAYVKRMGAVDVSGVEPMAHPLPIRNAFREDVTGPGLPLEKVLENAPDSDGVFFKVPQVIGDSDDAGG